MEIGDYVEIENGGMGIIRILEGYPPRKAYVDVFPGADEGYVYFRMYDPVEKNVVTSALNIYDLEDIKVIYKKEFLNRRKRYYKDR